MRLKDTIQKENFKIMALDDEQGIIDSLGVYLNKYDFVGYTDPIQAIEAIKNEHFDLLLLDFLMTPIHGDQVVEEIRKFNSSLYILLLTGHKDLAPPLETIKKFDIQGYCEKSDKMDQIILLVESGLKSVSQMRIIKEINEKLDLAYTELKEAYRGTVESLRYAVDAKDSYTKNHSDRVAYYSTLIGQKIGLSEQELEILHDGALFHDIGKIGIPDAILQKPGKLTDDEYDDIKNHPSIGAKILAPAKIFNDIIPIVKHHHERYDGRGYPSSLKEDEIPLFARIVGIADAFDAMTSDRSYRPRFTLIKALDELENGKGTQFDANLVDAFILAIKENKDFIEGELNMEFIARKDDNI
ncbi:MAG: HD-GYP domain-containing protein [Clostridia bacterium]|nr:HD-GYP domain-containing protein [Clostridia bacterium]